MDQLEAQGCGKVHLPNHRKVHLGTLRTSQKLPKIHTSKPLRPLDLFFCCPLPANQLGPGVGQSTDQRQAISRKRIRINCHCGSRLSRLFACNWSHWSQWFFLVRWTPDHPFTDNSFWWSPLLFYIFPLFDSVSIRGVGEHGLIAAC
jgi:hypothetical protein